MPNKAVQKNDGKSVGENRFPGSAVTAPTEDRRGREVIGQKKESQDMILLPYYFPCCGALYDFL